MQLLKAGSGQKAFLLLVAQMEEVLNKVQDKETELNGLPAERVPLRHELAAMRRELAALREDQAALRLKLLKQQNAQGVHACCSCTQGGHSGDIKGQGAR